MEDYKERNRKWILEHLKSCEYQVEELSYLRHEEIEKEYETLFRHSFILRRLCFLKRAFL